MPVASWVLFDFATTTFSYVVLTRYFNEWIVIERGQPDIVIGVISISVALALVVALPSLGVLADRLGRHKPLLVAFTLASVAGTALLGVIDGVALALVMAGIAIFAVNSAEAQYHPLLAGVAPAHRQSRVSGIGVAIGYIGALVALVLLGRLVSEGENQLAFLPTAGRPLSRLRPPVHGVRARPPPGAAR